MPHIGSITDERDMGMDIGVDVERDEETKGGEAKVESVKISEFSK